MKPKKFKDHMDRDGKFEPVPSQVIPYKRDDSKVEEVKKKIAKMRLDSVSNKNVKDSPMGYQFGAPSSEHVEEFVTNNDHFTKGNQKAQFEEFGQVETIQVKYVYRNLEKPLIAQKVEDQAWTLSQNARAFAGAGPLRF